MGKSTTNNTASEDTNAGYYDETDIPIITDAVLVGAEVVDAENPPSRNPNFMSIAAAPSPGACAVTAPPMQKQEQQQATVHINTAMVSAATTGNKSSQKRPFRTIKTLGRNATGLLCPHCQRQTVTVVEDYVGVGTVVAVIILAILFWPLCWLPLCVPTCKRTHHYCGHATCQKKVGETRVCA